MNLDRLLVGLAASWFSLVAAEALLQHHASVVRVRETVAKPLADASITPAAVARVELVADRVGWRYVLEDGLWRCPDFRNAYVVPDAMKALLEGILPGLGTVVSVDKRELEHYGMVPGRLLQIRLADAQGKRLLELSVGRGVPGSASGEAYVHLSGTREVVLLRFNPRSIAAPAPGKGPPLVDGRLLPKAFPRRDIEHIVFSGFAKYPVRSIDMVVTSTGPPRMPQPGQAFEPGFEWRARTAAGVRVLAAGNAGSYASYLERLKFRDIVPDGAPAASGFKALRGTLTLSDNAGNEDALEIGGDLENGGGTLVRNRRARMVFVVDSKKLPLLFPPVDALADKKQELNALFLQAEPGETLPEEPSAVEH